MKRDMELIRKILLQIEEKCDGTGAYPLDSIEGYSYEQIVLHMDLIEEADLVNNVKKLMGGSVLVDRLTNKGYDFLENIKNEEVWEKTKTEIKNKKLPETIEFISKVAGIFIGNIIGNMK